MPATFNNIKKIRKLSHARSSFTKLRVYEIGKLARDRIQWIGEFSLFFLFAEYKARNNVNELNGNGIQMLSFRGQLMDEFGIKQWHPDVMRLKSHNMNRIELDKIACNSFAFGTNQNTKLLFEYYRARIRFGLIW